MAVTVTEKLGSGALAKTHSGECGPAELFYIIEGTSGKQTALDELAVTVMLEGED